MACPEQALQHRTGLLDPRNLIQHPAHIGRTLRQQERARRMQPQSLHLGVSFQISRLCELFGKHFRPDVRPRRPNRPGRSENRTARIQHRIDTRRPLVFPTIRQPEQIDHRRIEAPATGFDLESPT